ncbi:hypothetical protein Ccrd_004986 [Cynara cardunculus var. scolymus]|uniref:LETM1-like protein n=1 Tax=Cynara cardunculus var. scolymus TaxID=59895 RepID=A0A103XLV8_CYNCS|nr:hypothetical protein Ccrd_004986 [Cynara cardunculus var. scolymus]
MPHATFWYVAQHWVRHSGMSHNTGCDILFSMKGPENYGSSTNNLLHGFLFRHCISSSQSRSSLRSLSSIASSGRDKIIAEDKYSVGIAHRDESEFNRVNCLVWVLHESARSFSVAIQTLQLARSGPELSNAWIGVDVNLWHKRIAYQVAVYALLRATIEVELFLSQKRCNSPVSEILSAKTSFLGEFVESQLNAKHPKLVQWFRTVELPRIAGSFISLFKKWSVEYAGSCCAAVRKLGSSRIACALFTESIDNVLVELMDLSCSLVTADKLHHLAMEAGFEDDFLFHFGKKVLPNKNIEDVEFWIGLVQKKLLLAFHREGVITGKLTFNDKIGETTLATLGIFAFLGRETRLFLSEMNIKDLDEQIKDFLRCKFHHDGRRSRQQAIQAEKEIILYNVLTTLLSYCLEEYWAAYDKPGKLMKFSERVPSDSTPSVQSNKGTTNSSILLEAQQKPVDLIKRRSSQDGSTIRKAAERGGGAETKPLLERLVRASTLKLVTANAFGLFVKQLCGNKITSRERGKIKRTLNDIATLIPITILMLIPIPSPYSSQRLNLVKQLERTKKMEIESWAIEDPGVTKESSRENEEDKSFTITMP